MPLIWQIPDDETQDAFSGEDPTMTEASMEARSASSPSDTASSDEPKETGRVGLIDFLKGPKAVTEMKLDIELNVHIKFNLVLTVISTFINRPAYHVWFSHAMRIYGYIRHRNTGLELYTKDHN